MSEPLNGPSRSFWSARRVLVTGGTGFVGSYMVERLLDMGAEVRVVGRSRARLHTVLGPRAEAVAFVEGDLGRAEVADAACADRDVVLHLAAHVSGVGYNSVHPATLLHDNGIVGLHLLDACARHGVERVLLTSSTCVYPQTATVPTPENQGFVSDPEPSNFGYGWAKRFLEVLGRGYAQQHGLQVCIVRPCNVYGPRDDFEWETNHVIPALIRRVVEGHDPITVWGDGTQRRGFVYVTDLVEMMLEACERHAVCEPINLGSGEEIQVADLVALIIALAGRDTRIAYDVDKPAGPPRRTGDLSRSLDILSYRPRVSMREGLAATIAWYLSTCEGPAPPHSSPRERH